MRFKNAAQRRAVFANMKSGRSSKSHFYTRYVSENEIKYLKGANQKEVHQLESDNQELLNKINKLKSNVTFANKILDKGYAVNRKDRIRFVLDK